MEHEKPGNSFISLDTFSDHQSAVVPWFLTISVTLFHTDKECSETWIQLFARHSVLICIGVLNDNMFTCATNNCDTPKKQMITRPLVHVWMHSISRSTEAALPETLFTDLSFNLSPIFVQMMVEEANKKAGRWSPSTECWLTTSLSIHPVVLGISQKRGVASFNISNERKILDYCWWWLANSMTHVPKQTNTSLVYWLFKSIHYKRAVKPSVVFACAGNPPQMAQSVA